MVLGTSVVLVVLVVVSEPSLGSVWGGVFQEDAKNFITLENLDQRIEEALDRPRNYNYAIDREGRVVKRTVLD